MLSSRALAPWSRPSTALLTLGVSLAAGATAAAILIAFPNPLRALLGLVAVGAGIAALLVPPAAVLALVGGSMIFWPGGLLKAAVAALTFCVLLWALAQRRPLVPRDSLFLLQFLFLLLSTVSMLSLLATTPDRIVADAWTTPLSAFGLSHERAIRQVGWYANDFALVWMILTVVTSPRLVNRMVVVMLLTGTIIALIGLVQFRTHFIWQVSEHTLTNYVAGYSSDFTVLSINGAFRIDSLTGVPDYMAMFMQILIPFALFWALRQGSRQLQIAGVIAVIAMAVAEVLTFSRMTMVSTVLVVIPYLVAHFGLRRSMPVLAGLAVVASAVIFGYGPIRERVMSIVTDTLTLDPTTAGGWRALMIPAAIQMFADHFFFGVGVGEHEALFNTYLPSYLHIDPRFNVRQPLENGYLLVGVEMGCLALLAMIALVWMVWRRTRQLRAYFRETGQKTLLDLAHASEIAWVCIAVNALFATVMDGTFRWLWVIVALVAVLSRIRTDQMRGLPAWDRV